MDLKAEQHLSEKQRPVQEDWHIQRHRGEEFWSHILEPSRCKAVSQVNKVATLEDYTFFVCVGRGNIRQDSVV